jgi:threonine aldolase
MGARLAAGLGPHVEILRPVDANIVFVRMPKRLAAALQREGFQFFEWGTFGDDAYRLVCGYATTAEDVDGLVEGVRLHAE